MHRKVNFTFFVVSLFVAATFSVAPPIWPQTFSQSFFIQFNDSTSTVTTGKFWYDSNVGAQRFDFQDGKTKFACGVIYQEPTKCTVLTANQTLYIVLPDKNLCCNGGPSDIIDRFWLQNYTYLGETPIDGEGFYEWTELVQQASPKYFSDTSALRIPRRWSFKRVIVMDYLKASYSEKAISSSVFSVPSYCNQQCTEIIKEKDPASKAEDRMNAIKAWTRILRTKTKKLSNLLREQ